MWHDSNDYPVEKHESELWRLILRFVRVMYRIVTRANVVLNRNPQSLIRMSHLLNVERPFLDLTIYRLLAL